MNADELTDALLDEMTEALFELASGGEFSSDEDLRHGLREVFDVLALHYCMKPKGHADASS